MKLVVRFTPKKPKFVLNVSENNKLPKNIQNLLFKKKLPGLSIKNIGV